MRSQGEEPAAAAAAAAAAVAAAAAAVRNALQQACLKPFFQD